MRISFLGLALTSLVLVSSIGIAAEPVPADVPKAFIDGTGPGWRTLTEDDFTNVNCDADTWTWKGGDAHCTGTPVGVIRTKKTFTNLEMVAEWRHLKSAGNSGIFLWASKEALTDLPRNALPPGGIEVQVLDHGYAEQYVQQTGKQPEWFGTNGDVFPVGTSDMKPLGPPAPDGKRSFASKALSRGTPEWNHYYIRAINGEVRLWVNGEEVSGGTDCNPAFGYICLESEGSPVEFRSLRIRELP